MLFIMGILSLDRTTESDELPTVHKQPRGRLMGGTPEHIRNLHRQSRPGNVTE
jgi:hypothetical protein